MRTVRLVYLWTCYILALPLGMAFVIPYCIYAGIRYGIADVKETINAIIEGIALGHRLNMLFVNYGRNWQEKVSIEEAF